MKSLKILSILSLLILVSCTTTSPSQPSNPSESAPVPTQSGTTEAKTGLANPASENCLKLGGQLVIKKKTNGGEYGVCMFEDNRQCEEWALMRGECPKGGRKITGYDTYAEIYCAITGGTVIMDKKNPILCELPNSAGSCGIDEYYTKGMDCTGK